MLDPTMLMLHGLMDHPYIIDMETKRLNDEAAEKKFKEILKRCMDNQMIRDALLFDENLVEAFIEAQLSEMKRVKA